MPGGVSCLIDALSQNTTYIISLSEIPLRLNHYQKTQNVVIMIAIDCILLYTHSDSSYLHVNVTASFIITLTAIYTTGTDYTDCHSFSAATWSV